MNHFYIAINQDVWFSYLRNMGGGNLLLAVRPAVYNILVPKHPHQPEMQQNWITLLLMIPSWTHWPAKAPYMHVPHKCTTHKYKCGNAAVHIISTNVLTCSCSISIRGANNTLTNWLSIQVGHLTGCVLQNNANLHAYCAWLKNKWNTYRHSIYYVKHTHPYLHTRARNVLPSAWRQWDLDRYADKKVCSRWSA